MPQMGPLEVLVVVALVAGLVWLVAKVARR